MIVMKFGGSSLESSEALSRVCGIVKSHLHRRPVVVVSAIGKTTNHLLSMAGEASRGHGYNARRTLDALQDTHFRIAEDLVSGKNLDSLERSLQNSFRELHGVIRDLSEDGRTLTAQLSDSIVSFGERLSSEITAAALLETHVPAVHLDSREVIVTDDHFGSAAPLLWETYARLRRRIPYIAENNVPVMGGFIGSTGSGATTTLGRGGSDLTASLVGAGICADEIQIWTDVDGMLSCDPRVLRTVYRVRSISYAEATTMAGCGAKVLHPDTAKPAVRQRIPLVIRNSRRPEHEGTSISPVAGPCFNAVKTIAVKENLLVFEIRSRAELLAALQDFCYRRNIEPALLQGYGDTVYLGLSNTDVSRLGSIENLQGDIPGGFEVRLRKDMAWISLIGEGVCREANVTGRALHALRSVDATLAARHGSAIALSLMVPQRELKRSCRLLHDEFFAQIDASAFALVTPEEPKQTKLDPMAAYAMRKITRYGNARRMLSATWRASTS